MRGRKPCRKRWLLIRRPITIKMPTPETMTKTIMSTQIKTKITTSHTIRTRDMIRIKSIMDITMQMAIGLTHMISSTKDIMMIKAIGWILAITIKTTTKIITSMGITMIINKISNIRITIKIIIKTKIMTKATSDITKLKMS